MPWEESAQTAKYLTSVVADGTATLGQKAWLESYKKNPMAAPAIHYFHSEQADGRALTKWQQAHLDSYNRNPHAPSYIHYFAQVIADDEQLNPDQQKMLKTYQNSLIPEPKPRLPVIF